MKLKIISDGTPLNTTIVNADTGEPIGNIYELEFKISADQPGEAVIKFSDIPVEILASAERRKGKPDFPFFSDGCSMAPDLNFGGCCYDHDILYHQGGSAGDRFAADRKLFACIRGKNGFAIAAIYFIAVRLFGGPLLPTFFRWGYGWNYKKSWTYAQQKRLNSK